MPESDEHPPRPVGWLAPRLEQEGLQRYVQTLREGRRLLALTVVLTTLVALVYVLLAPTVYTAEADLLVTPVAREDPALGGLGLLRDSSDPTRDVETAARLVENTPVAARAGTALRLSRSPAEILADVSADPVAQSNIVAVRARASTPRDAQALADAFAQAAVDQRTDGLHRQLAAQIPRLTAQLKDAPAADARTGTSSLAERLAALQALSTGPDPTMRVETPAELPGAPTSPKRGLAIVAGIFAGLILGIGGAFAVRALDPRLRREDQLRELYRLPILARVPNERHPVGRPLLPRELGHGAREAYRRLQTVLGLARGEDGPRAVLITSASAGEGKTTTAINVASALAIGGDRVILVEADLRRPVLGAAFGVEAGHGTGSLLLGRAELDDCLVTTKPYGPFLRLLLADRDGQATGWLADWLMLPAARRLVDACRAQADYVIIDSPPLAVVIDALPLAQTVDDVLVVVRLGRTRLARLGQLAELLDQQGIEPAGFAVLGVPSPALGEDEGYGYAPAERPPPDLVVGPAEPGV